MFPLLALYSSSSTVTAGSITTHRAWLQVLVYHLVSAVQKVDIRYVCYAGVARYMLRYRFAHT